MDDAHKSVLRHTTRSAATLRDTETDAQVAQIKNDPRPLSLCDVVVGELMAGRHPERPIVSRVAVIGEIAIREEPLRNVLESLISLTARKVNAEDPSGGLLRTRVTAAETSPNASPNASPTIPSNPTQLQTSTVNITGVCVEYTKYFLAVFESEPLHLVELMRAIGEKNIDKKNITEISSGVSVAASAKSAGKASADNVQSSAVGPSSIAGAAGSSVPVRTSLDKVHIIYQVDDIVSRETSSYTHIDATSLDSGAKGGGASANSEANAMYSAVPLDSQVVKAVYNMLALGTHSQGLSSKAMREHFSSGAVSTHPKLLPPLAFVNTCLKSDLCLTVDEYLQVFGSIPTVDRDKELVNPLEPPLQY